MKRFFRLIKHRRIELANDPGYKSLYTYTYDTNEDEWLHFFAITYSTDPEVFKLSNTTKIKLWRFGIELP